MRAGLSETSSTQGAAAVLALPPLCHLSLSSQWNVRSHAPAARSADPTHVPEGLGLGSGRGGLGEPAPLARREWSGGGGAAADEDEGWGWGMVDLGRVDAALEGRCCCCCCPAVSGAGARRAALAGLI